MNEICRPLTHEEITVVYNAWGPEHFPDSELKPLSTVRTLLERGQYSGYGLFTEADTTVSGLLGYALLLHDKDRSKMLLDYYAFLEEHRCKGLGSVFLHELRRQKDFPGCFIECEDPETAASEEERILQERRICFYERNGAVLTQVRARLFGVTYRMLVLSPTAIPQGGKPSGTDECGGCVINQEAFLETLRDFYLSIYPLSVFEKNFRLWIA